MSDILAEICDTKRTHIARRKQERSIGALHAELDALNPTHPPRDFLVALKAKQEAKEVGLIAEIKQASPSRGVIREDFDPAALAQDYAKGGAVCLSVLTDEPYFQGQDAYLREARDACQLPVLRKDFTLDPYQVVEARVLGADCILLIMAALEDVQARELEDAAHSLGMNVLIEVHDAKELDRALEYLSSPLIGINNRNLKTLEVSLETSETLAGNIPEGYMTVCESGIKTHEDITRMQSQDIHCFLVGESLMLQRNVTEATRRLIYG